MQGMVKSSTAVVSNYFALNFLQFLNFIFQSYVAWSLKIHDGYIFHQINNFKADGDWNIGPPCG